MRVFPVDTIYPGSTAREYSYCMAISLKSQELNDQFCPNFLSSMLHRVFTHALGFGESGCLPEISISATNSAGFPGLAKRLQLRSGIWMPQLLKIKNIRKIRAIYLRYGVHKQIANDVSTHHGAFLIAAAGSVTKDGSEKPPMSLFSSENFRLQSQSFVDGRPPPLLPVACGLPFRSPSDS